MLAFGRSPSAALGAVPKGALQQLLQQLGSAGLQGAPACDALGTDGLVDWADSTPSTSYSLLAQGAPPRPCRSSTRPSSAPLPFAASAAASNPLHQPQSVQPQSPASQLQQLRGYRIPVRVLLPKVPYSVKSGRPAPRPWPQLEPVTKPPPAPQPQADAADAAAPGPAPASAPAPELRWHRSVVRFPPEVAASLEGGPEGARTLVLTGKAGTIRLSLQDLDPTALLAYRLVHLPPPASAPASAPGRSLLLLLSPDKARFEAVGAALNSAVRGVMAGYLLGLTAKGVGYRMEPLEDGPEAQAAARAVSLTPAQLALRARSPNGARPKPFVFEGGGDRGAAADAKGGRDGGKGAKGAAGAGAGITFPFNKPAAAIRLKVGYSRTAVYPLPPHVRAFFLKPTLVYLYGLELDELKRVAAEIRSVRPPNPYTGNGVQYVDEVVKIKARKGAK
ncbi:hypothetical protein HYH03_005870 [Edaphochlamys debaryana]|uniref:Ribosomal protein L6 n=1 Tax=Edaphochlamys debaryana TaxID=47281 RepID=A0A836C1W1_9CHLO|nr:hypothetical protein HYH03_005870 [Edaphochlamys debaryana]|eukprot:KAG2495939.1 hypothetical protein HYH03_005870 [Edaphochlamys debaryana]